MQPKSNLVPLALGLSWALVMGAAGARGQSTAPEPSAPAETKGGGGEDQQDDSSFLSKIRIHGFLSQAYGFSDGNQIIGIPKDGTADYRTAALQIRADMTEDDTFAVQLSHERLGLSPIQALHDDVELDWIFYERRFGQSAVKVGRLPIPFGIYNEVRDVGTVLPLYRPARPLYEETAFATETVDGVLASHEFNLPGDWSLKGDVHFGNWENFDAQLHPVKASDSTGVELWLETPVSGLRFGVGGLRFDARGTTTPHSYRQVSHFSVDADFTRLDAQVEIKRDTAQKVAGGRLANVWAGYGHLGVHLTDHWVAHGEYDFLHVWRDRAKTAKDVDRALALSYFFRPDLVLKAEYHWTNGFRADNSPGLIPGRPTPDFATQFGILSLSTSF